MPDQISIFLNSLSFEGYDLWISVGIITLIFIFLFTLGKDYAITLLISVYMAIVTMLLVPVIVALDFDAGIENYQIKLIVFVVLIIFFFWFQARNEYFEPYTVPTSWENGVFAVLISGMILYFVATLLPISVVDELNPIMIILFIEQPVTNAWMILPVLTLLFLRGRT